MKMMKITTLLIMALLHFVAMYFLMYSMVDKISNVYLNLNNLYMACLMTAPMLILEAVLMGSMYENKKAIKTLAGISLVVLVLFFFFIRKQIAITDKEFLRSMIPHHSGAILMCGESQIKDQEIKKLCQSITRSQQSEIDQMKKILNRLEKR